MGPSIPPMFKSQDLVQSSFPGNIANIDTPDRAYVALKASCDRQGHYPCNLLQRKQLQSATERYRRYLDDGEKTLFNISFEEIHFLELKENSTDFQEFIIRNTPSVQKQLHQDDRDPTSRFVFIQADHSRAPLNCSRDSFSHILSYHQVPPGFIDYVAAFGATHYPTDYHMTGFDSDDTLTVRDSNVVKISKLGRSGREHRMQYLLRSIETDSTADESRRWNIRQTAVYHSFDFIEGKALWINIKANSRLEDMVKEATADSAIVNPAAMSDPAESFSSTLTIHLIFLEWCDMDWRKCINDCEKKIRTILAKAQTSRVTPPAKFNTPTKRALALIEAKTSDLSSTKKLSNAGHSLWQWTLRRRPKLLHWDIEFNEKLGTVENEQHVQEQQLNYLDNLDSFSFDEIQDLHHWGEQLESYRLVMELNHQAMRDIVERYQNLSSRPDLPAYIEEKCMDDINYFVQRVERIQKNLEIRIVQVKSLISWLEDGKSLFDRIIQYRNAQIGRIFTESSFGQSQKMERIAYKTEKETISMHVITCVTLAFLPPMFVATFFQSGLVEVNAAATSVSNSVVFHDNAFGLFAAICFPLMAVTFVLWVAVFRCLSKRSRSRVTSDVVLA